MREQVMGELKRTFRPEFLNRIDDVIVFHSLEREHIHRIVNLMLFDLEGRLAEFDLRLEVTEEARGLLAERGYDPTYGARPLRRAIQNLVEDSLSEEMLKGTFSPGSTILVDLDNSDKLTFTRK